MSYSTFSRLGGGNCCGNALQPIDYCTGMTLDVFSQTGQPKLGRASHSCQVFMSDYCASNWDSKCQSESNMQGDAMSNLRHDKLPAMRNLQQGEVLIRNTADKKYGKPNQFCSPMKFQFDQMTGRSPMLTEYVGVGCAYNHDVDAKSIDSDAVMNRVLDDPSVAFDVLVSIYNTRVNNKNIGELANTRLGKYFNGEEFQRQYVKYANRL